MFMFCFRHTLPHMDNDGGSIFARFLIKLCFLCILYALVSIETSSISVYMHISLFLDDKPVVQFPPSSRNHNELNLLMFALGKTCLFQCGWSESEENMLISLKVFCCSCHINIKKKHNLMTIIKTCSIGVNGTHKIGSGGIELHSLLRSTGS